MVELWADSARMTTCGYCRGDSAKLIFNGRTCHMVELKLTATVRTSADRLRPYPSGSEDIIVAESSGTLFSDFIRRGVLQMRTAKRALSLLLCVIMVISLMTIIPVTAFEANAASYNADEVQAQTVSGQQIKIPNVWSARRSIESGKTYTISWLKGNTARLLTLNGNEPYWRDQTVIKGTSGMPYYFNASANANELWTTSRDGGWYWQNNSNNY